MPTEKPASQTAIIVWQPLLKISKAVAVEMPAEAPDVIILQDGPLKVATPKAAVTPFVSTPPRPPQGPAPDRF
ncbi:MAG: hypothetical protein K0S29_229 [Gammaproteobacteria bacterium]|jgi:hypothetical protein|nr:hypothetical protein [Gammaproteobacteria bacterium]